MTLCLSWVSIGLLEGFVVAFICLCGDVLKQNGIMAYVSHIL